MERKNRSKEEMSRLVASRLRMLRDSAGHSREEMGRILGVSPSTLQRYETGQREPAYSVLVEYALYFDVSADWLIGLADVPHHEMPSYEQWINSKLSQQIVLQNSDQNVEALTDLLLKLNRFLYESNLNKEDGNGNGA